MTTETRTDWTDVLINAAQAIRLAPALDLTPIHAATELASRASAAVATDGLETALRWASIDEATLAVVHDLGRLDPTAEHGAVSSPEAPFLTTAATRSALRELWTAIYGGLNRYMMHAQDGRAAVCAAVTARSVLRVIEAGADL
jgi:hypothetical protein